MSKVIGFDPGTHRLGWGVIQGTPNRQTVVGCGCIESPPGTSQADYLLAIDTQVKDLLKTHQPDLVGIETLLFQKNVSTAITVAQARGVVLLASASSGLQVLELAPNTVKLAVAGAGNATKPEVKRMVGLLLGLTTDTLLDDTTDALAVAVAALVSYKR